MSSRRKRNTAQNFNGYRPSSINSQNTVKKIFNAAQHGRAACKNNLPKLKQLFNTMDLEDFLTDFTLCLRINFMNSDRFPALEYASDFAAMFCASILEEDVEETPLDNVNDKNNVFISELFTFLFQASNAFDHSVRYRSCQFINKVLCQMGDEASLEDEICNKLSNRMIERLKDKSPSVRTQAVLALHRLQEPSNPACPVIANFLHHLENDPSYEVRKSMLPVLARTAAIIPHIIRRTNDIKDIVRRQAYSELAKLKMRSLTIKQRENLLMSGLKDRSEIVRVCVAKKLLTSWLDSSNGDYFELLYSLDVEMYTETCSLALDTLFEGQHIDTLIDNLIPFLEDRVVKQEKLTSAQEKYSSAIAFYWKSLAKYICKKREKDLEKKEEELERITPNLSPYVAYVRSYYNLRKTCEESSEDPFIAVRHNFNLLQLLDLAKVFDYSDEMGRSELKQLILDMLIDDTVKGKLIPCLVELLENVIPVVNDRLQQLAETISEIREPLVQVSVESNPDDRIQLQLQQAKLRVQLNEAKEQMEDAIRAQEFMKAQEMKNEVDELQRELSKLMNVSNEPEPEPVRQERTDPDTIHKCLSIVYEMTQSPDVTTLTPQLRSLCENFVLPCTELDDVDLLILSLKAFGCMCLLDEQLARDKIVLFMYKLLSFQEEEEVTVTSLTAIFDILHLYGLEPFQITANGDEEDKPNNKSRSKKLYDATMNDFDVDEVVEDNTDTNNASHPNTSHSPENEDLQIISIVTELLSSNSSALQFAAVKGLCRLLISSRIVSANLISRLIILWFNPSTDDIDVPLKQYLGVFFTGFATTCARSGEILEQAFLPTLQTLFNAPLTSPLSTIDLGTVGRLFIGLTRPGIVERRDLQVNVHNNLALTICNEALKTTEPDFKSALLALLPSLHVTTDDNVFQEQLQVLVDKIKDSTLEKYSVRHINKFQQILLHGSSNLTHTTATLSERESASPTSRRNTASPTSRRNTNKLSTNPDLSTVQEVNEASDVESVSGQSVGRMSVISEESCFDEPFTPAANKTDTVIPESPCSDYDSEGSR